MSLAVYSERWLRQVARYLAVGGGANVVVVGLYYILTLGIGVEHRTALTLASFVGLGLSYVGQRRWAFEYCGSAPKSLGRYAVGYLASYAFQLAVLHVGVNLLGYQHEIVVLFGLASATILFYGLQRFWIFPERRPPSTLTCL